MADLSITARSVRPLPQAIIRDFIAGGSGNVGDAVYIDTTGKVQQGNAGAAGTAIARGIVVGAGGAGVLTFAAGDTVSVVLLGGVVGFSGAAKGVTVFLSNTAGKIADAAGTVSKKMGLTIDDTIVYVQPEP